MSSTATVIDPAEVVTAAVHELFEHLRKIVDRGPTDDPALVDEVGRLNGRIRSKITRARKRAQAADATTVEPTPAAPTSPASPTASASSAVPAATPVPPADGDRVTVRLPDARPAPVPASSSPKPARRPQLRPAPPQPFPRSTVSSTSAAGTPKRGRHRRSRRRRQATLGEHFFWTVVASVAACLVVAVIAFVTT